MNKGIKPEISLVGKSLHMGMSLKGLVPIH